MAREFETLLDRATPDDAAPVDIDALHRRGVRRRWVSRVAAGSVGVAAVALVAVTGTSLGSAPVVGVDPVGPENADTAPTGVATGVAFAPGEQEVAAAAATLPDPGSRPAPEDWRVLSAEQSDGQEVWLRTNEVSCLYADGDGPSATAPEGARSNRVWNGAAATEEDLIATCLDSDAIRSELNHAPGPFTLCQGTPAPDARQEMLDNDATGMLVSSDEHAPPVTFPTVVTWDTDCSAGDQSTRAVAVGPPEDEDALLARFNDRRRVEAAVRARAATECLSPTDALALAEATADRFGQDWRILSLIEPDGARTRPCIDVTIEPHWGTIHLQAASAHDVDVGDVAPPSDATTRQALADAIRDGDGQQAAGLLDVVRARVERGAGAIDDAAVDAMFADEPSAREVAHLAQATDCLTRRSAVDLAWALHDVLSEHAPDHDWVVGQVPGPDATCLQAQVTTTASDARGATGHGEAPPPESMPEILLRPVWAD